MSDSDLLTMLSEQSARLFGDLVDRELLASVESNGPPDALVAALEEFGLADALAIPAEEGGLTLLDAGTLFDQFGYHALPLPLAETILARRLLGDAGLEAPAGFLGIAGRNGEGLACGAMLAGAIAREGDKIVLRPIAAQGHPAISRQARAKLDTNAPALAEAAWPAAWPNPIALGAAIRSSQMAGAIARLLDLSVDYANTRKQFGRPIGQFQAIQQLLAQLAAEAAAARSAAASAWAAMDRGAPGIAVHVAKIRTGEAARTAAAIAHQVHGAIGVTDEHVLHYFTRRLWEWRLDFGSDGFWAARLGEALRASGADAWTFLTTNGAPRLPEPA
jgi:acyl-CoA dehydrogenase